MTAVQDIMNTQPQIPDMENILFSHSILEQIMGKDKPVWTGVLQLSPYRPKWWSLVRVFTPTGPQQCVDVLITQLVTQRWSEGFPLKRRPQLHDDLWKIPIIGVLESGDF